MTHVHLITHTIATVTGLPTLAQMLAIIVAIVGTAGCSRRDDEHHSEGSRASEYLCVKYNRKGGAAVQEVMVFQYSIGEAETEVVFVRESMHPVLAEYKRKILVRESASTSTAEYILPDNMGGKTRIKVYASISEDGLEALFLIDQYGCYLVDMNNGSVSVAWTCFGETIDTKIVPPQLVFIGHIVDNDGEICLAAEDNLHFSCKEPLKARINADGR